MDRDGGCDDDNSPLESWWICLTTPFGDNFCKQADALGQVRWDGLITGDYTVFESVPGGWLPVGPASVNVALTDTVAVVSFCNVQTTNKGACCGPWGSMACVQAYESRCVNQGGIFKGIGTDCGNEICSTPATPSSWGRIKAMYR